MKKVAIVGVEGSGKTVMLAGLGELYSHPDESGFFLAPKDFATMSYVTSTIAKMRQGSWPSATAEDVLQGLDWTVRKKGDATHRKPVDVCEMSCLDFAGEVYRSAFGINADSADSKEVESLKEHIRNADGIIVLINLRDVIVKGMQDKRVQESIWITNAILSYALDTSDGRKAPRAAIVLSQADSYANTINSCGGAKGVLENYLPHVANSYGWLSVFEVRTVDKTIVDDDGNVVPAPDFSPVGLRPLLDWILVRDIYIVEIGQDPLYTADTICNFFGWSEGSSNYENVCFSVNSFIGTPVLVITGVAYSTAYMLAKQLAEIDTEVAIVEIGEVPKVTARKRVVPYPPKKIEAKPAEAKPSNIIPPVKQISVVRAYFGSFAKYAVFKGRSSRAEFWKFMLVHISLEVLVFIIALYIMYNSLDEEHTVLNYFLFFGGVPYSMLGIIPTLSAIVRRMHDANFSGWWLLLFLAGCFIPYLNILVIIALIFLLCVKGTIGSNKYGDNPL